MAQTHSERNQQRTDELLDDAARGSFGQRLCGATIAAVAIALVGTASLIHNPEPHKPQQVKVN